MYGGDELPRSCQAFLVEQVLQLLAELEAKIIKDGEETQKLYDFEKSWHRTMFSNFTTSGVREQREVSQQTIER